MAYRMSSSSICTHFTQNAWKKDLCSNCFKSKDEHKQLNVSNGRSTSASSNKVSTNLSHSKMTELNGEHKKTDYPNKHKSPAKSIIKLAASTTTTTTTSTTIKSHKSVNSKLHKVTFPKHLSEVIGYGGEWSDNDSDDDDDHDFMNLDNEHEDDNAATSTDDEATIELKRITRANTDFNMNNGNLLGDPQENIKKSFAALKLGAPQVDKEGKKQTLKINVVPFGAAVETQTHNAQNATATVASNSSTTATTAVKAKFEVSKSEQQQHSEKLATKQSVTIVKAVKKTLPTLSLTSTTSTTSMKTTSSLKTKQDVAVAASTSTARSSSSSSSSTASDSDGKNSPPLERAMEKSLLDEISETLEQKQIETKKLAAEKASTTTTTTSIAAATPSNQKIKFELTSLSDAIEPKPFLDLKRPISRNAPITKDQTKPKINVFHKYSDSDSNCSDAENGVSAYYDVVETQVCYENLPDGKCNSNKSDGKLTKKQQSNEKTKAESKDVYSSSQYITDMLLSSKTRAASYNLHEGNFMTSKITADGLVVTKCSSDDALDSTGSSFDGSSDEETSYNMIRSESDSGIGISIGSNEYKNLVATNAGNAAVGNGKKRAVEKKLSVSTNNSDYEDIQVTDQQMILKKQAALKSQQQTTNFSLEKRRELHGEPDGSADPDGSLESKDTKAPTTSTQKLPALPKSPPPTKLIDPRPSFLHGASKQQPILLKKPDLPAKPVMVSPINTPMKTFMATTAAKRQQQTTNMEQQQVISQLQMTIMTKSNENLNADSAKDDGKLRKGRAPNPPPEQPQTPTQPQHQQRQKHSSAPPTPERDYNISIEFETATQKQNEAEDSKQPEKSKEQAAKVRTEIQATTSSTSAVANSNNLYARKQQPTTLNLSSNNSTTATAPSPVIREKDKRERAVINPKFRSLNTFATQRNNAAKNLQLQEATSTLSLKQLLTPEPTLRHQKQLSGSEECLAASLISTLTSGSMANLATPTTPTSTSSSDKKSSTAASPTKPKAKFSIKKFLRMGSSSSGSSSSNSSKHAEHQQKKESIYTEICTGDDGNSTGKPRLVIIHPIDINPTAVEVVKDITKTNDAVAAQTVAVLTAKPPAPPLRNIDRQNTLELNKPARPPPPKSAEMRRKQQAGLSTPKGETEVGKSANSSGGMGTTATAASGCNSDGTDSIGGGSIKSKADNVYANLGEIRSAIAPRKPERTASMREREAQLELARKRHASGTNNKNATAQRINQNENINGGDTISICSSNGENVSSSTTATEATIAIQKFNNNSHYGGQQNDGKSSAAPAPAASSRTSTFERKKATNMINETKPIIASKLEIFESRNNNATATATTTAATNNNNNNETRPSSLKDSVRKINSTIDSYLKDKRDYENMYEFVKTSTTAATTPTSPPPPPLRSVDLSVAGQRLLPPRRNQQFSDTVSVASFTRSEYGATTRGYGGLSAGSLANIPRGISASYCGSEVGEFDIYAPYSYYGSEAGGDVGSSDINDSVWGTPSATKNRIKATNRLRMRKGRSVVHKTIEDNYTAVVVANHEALAQVLEQLQQTPVIPQALRPLANAINLRFEDFAIIDGAQAFVVGKKAFHGALWSSAPVTLSLSADCNQLSGIGGGGELCQQLSGGISGVLNPITEFCDLVPSYHLPLMPTTEVTLMQATISVLPRLQLDTLQSIGAILKGKSQVLDKSNFNFRGSIPNLAGLKDGSSSGSSNTLRNVVSVQNLSTLNEETAHSMEKLQNEQLGGGTIANSATVTASGMPAFDDVMTREVAFIMLQLVNGMKNLQVKAIEEMPLSLSNVVLSKDVDNKDAQARLCVLQGNNNDEDEPMGTLCKCAHIALTEMMPSTKITPILADILLQERSESLSKAKSVLEFVLWGPSDVVLSGSTKERELALQRWLDLERATVLHGLVRTRIELTVYDECHLMFLVRSTAKIMNDAAKIVCGYQQQSTATNLAEPK